MSYPTNNQSKYVQFQGLQSKKEGSKKNFLKGFLQIFELGIFELAVVAIILGLFFTLLNYFNIINLPRIYTPLSALPKIVPTIIPSPFPTSFVYDKNASSTLLLQYFSQNLASKYEFLINTVDQKNTQQTNNIISYTLNLDDKTTVRGKLFNKNYSNDYDYLQLSIENASTSAQLQNATASASQILSTVMKPYAGSTPLTCSPSGGTQICEQFTTTSFGDNGQGVLWNKDNTYLIFSCKIFPNSIYHQVKKSCLPLL